jgi:molecular chaperone DnaJ
MAKDYYQTLGVSRTATADELKKAYRTLAMKHHPDKNQGKKDTEVKFKEINEAYETLKDDQKRAAYDRYGHDGFQQATSGGGFNPGAGSGFGFSSFSDILDEMFGGNTGGQQHANMKQGGNDIRYDATLTLEEAFKGKTLSTRFTTLISCDACHGSGGEAGSKPQTCTACKGRGQTRFQQGFFTIERTCTTCQGAGQTLSNPCKKCHGQGRVRGEKKLDIKIPAGVDDGNRIRIAKEGESGICGGPTGDLYVFVNVKPHHMFKREGNDIYCRVPITMTKAALGGDIEVASIDGSHVPIKIAAGSQHGHHIKTRQKGMVSLRGTNRGDMIVELVIEIPVNLSKKQKDILMKFDEDTKESNHNPQSTGFFIKLKEFWDDLAKGNA